MHIGMRDSYICLLRNKLVGNECQNNIHNVMHVFKRELIKSELPSKKIKSFNR